MLVTTSAALALSAQSTAQPPISAPRSPTSATRANDSAASQLARDEPVRTGSGRDPRESIPKWGAGGDRPLNERQQLINACAAAADDLEKTRELVTALEKENAALRQRVETGRLNETLLMELNETRRSETEALRAALAAKNETIAAKDAVIATQDEMIRELRKRKSSPWKRIGDVLIGVAISAVLK